MMASAADRRRRGEGDGDGKEEEGGGGSSGQAPMRLMAQFLRAVDEGRMEEALGLATTSESR